MSVDKDTFKLFSCRKCKTLVDPKADICPECGAVAPTMSLAKIIVGSTILIGILAGGLNYCSNKTSKSKGDEAANIRRGFHCLSAWDGSHAGFKDEVKAKMRDPKSFEHIETKISPASNLGTHNITMTYRAKNGLGGYTLGKATGTVDGSDCKHKIASIE